MDLDNVGCVYTNFCLFYPYKLQITFFSKGRTEADGLHSLITEAGVTLGQQKTAKKITKKS
jgi:hypothetical protein